MRSNVDFILLATNEEKNLHMEFSSVKGCQMFIQFLSLPAFSIQVIAPSIIELEKLLFSIAC